MIRAFIGTNVLIDFMVQSEHRVAAVRLFTHAKHRRVELYSTADSFMTADYVLRKYMKDAKKRKVILLTLLRYTNIIDITRRHLETALSGTEPDFEDAAKYEAARHTDGLNFFVTRDKKGFKTSPLKVTTSEALVRELQNV